MRKGKGIAVWAMLISGCASVLRTYELRSFDDDVTGAHYDLMSHNILVGAGLTGGEVAFEFQRYISPFTADTTFDLFVTYRASEWIFIEDGPSLLLRVDGALLPVVAEAAAPTREVIRGGGIYERRRYAMTPALLRRLVAADSVRVRVVGSRASVDRSFGAENRARLRTFVSRFVPPDSLERNR